MANVKLNLGCGQDIRKNYLNVDLYIEDKNVIRGDFVNLNGFGIKDNSVDEILAVNIIQLIPMNALGKIIHHWSTKLKSDGEIFIQAPSAESIGNMLAHNQAPITEVQELIFGTPPHNQFRSLYDMSFIETLLKQIGFAIVSKNLNGPYFSIRAKIK